MEPKSLATEILKSVESMVDPKAPAEQQLSQMRAQLEALSELPSLINQKLEAVSQQMNQISMKKETMKKEVVQEQRTVEVRKQKDAHQTHQYYQQQFQPKKPGNQHSVQITELEPDEPGRGIQIRVTKPSLTGEDLDELQREQLRRSLEDVRMRKSVSPTKDVSTQSSRREQRPRKPSPAFGPNLQERPVYLPTREKRTKMEYDENQISETLVGQAEVIRGRVMGVNFKKFEKPPVNLDHLKNSEVYRMIHNMDSEPLKGVATLQTARAAEEYMQRARSMSPATTGPEGR